MATITLHGHTYTVMSAKTQQARRVWSAYMRSGKKWLIYITKDHDYAIDYEAI